MTIKLKIVTKKLTLFFLLFLCAITLPSFCFASEIQYPPVFGLSLNDTSTFPEYARYFFSIGIFISATLAAIVIIFGGIYYLISFGSGKFTGEGKEWIKAGFLGLFLILGSYLIVYTINPDLAIFRLNGLKPVIVADPIPEILNPNTPKVIYNEIPIGILTENVLTKTMDCYNFDSNGDPVSAPLDTDDRGRVFGPTLTNNDRTDCVLKLAAAAAKKSEIIKKLSDDISGLMSQCSCEGKCDSTCNPNNPNACGQPQIGANGEKSCPTGECKDAACKAPKNGSGECCEQNVKDQIENGLDQFRNLQSDISGIIEKQVRVDEKTVIIIDQDKWKNLKTAEQLTYLKEKIENFKSKIENDLKQLTNAAGDLDNCYYSTSYIDFLKLYEGARPEEKIILKNKTYSDSETKDKINISKYCNGFSYGDSSCFNVCQNVCPGDSQKDLSCYKSCKKCDIKDFDNESDYYDCIDEQKPCMEKCYNQRKCLPNDNYGNFERCVSYCKVNCSDSCSNEFSDDPKGLADCQKKCDTNSQCLMQNETKCIFNSNGLRQCAGAIDNGYYLKDCVNNSYLCKYGSQQHSGYPECLEYPYSKSEKYSASFIFQHQGYQVCPDLYAPFEEDSDTPCIDIYPETGKCPSASNCPDCPCGTVKDGKISENNVVSGQCSELAYNDDPLTFYCEQNWWNNKKEKLPKPIGNERFCSEENEIPVGRTVDDTENWANSLIKILDDISKNTKDLLGYIKQIGEEQGYCKCDSACEGGRPCSTSCKYVAATSGEDVDGNSTSTPESCAYQACKGISCQKIINLLKGGKTDNCPAEQKGVGFYNDKIYYGYKELYAFVVSEKRSDILKELTYSRTTTNACSLIKNANGDQAKLLSCLRAEDGIIPPIGRGETIVNEQIIKAHCYGQNLWKEGVEGLTDNWFCCEKR